MCLGYQRPWKKKGIHRWITWKNKRAQNVIRVRYEWFYRINKMFVIKIERNNKWKIEMHVINLSV